MRGASVSTTERENAPKNNRKAFGSATNIILALIGLLISAGPVASENTNDWVTGLPREPIYVKAWPGGKKGRSLLHFLCRGVGFWTWA